MSDDRMVMGIVILQMPEGLIADCRGALSGVDVHDVADILRGLADQIERDHVAVPMHRDN